jgi:hypothetical protein
MLAKSLRRIRSGFGRGSKVATAGFRRFIFDPSHWHRPNPGF